MDSNVDYSDDIGPQPTPWQQLAHSLVCLVVCLAVGLGVAGYAVTSCAPVGPEGFSGHVPARAFEDARRVDPLSLATSGVAPPAVKPPAPPPPPPPPSACARPAGGTAGDGFDAPRPDQSDGRHKGVDIFPGFGQPLYAIKAGQVIGAGLTHDGLGAWVKINHSATGFPYYSTVGHINEWFVKKGDWVQQGQVIATVGNRGKSSGPHVHFEIRQAWNNKPVEPLAVLAACGVAYQRTRTYSGV